MHGDRLSAQPWQWLCLLHAHAVDPGQGNWQPEAIQGIRLHYRVGVGKML